MPLVVKQLEVSRIAIRDRFRASAGFLELCMVERRALVATDGASKGGALHDRIASYGIAFGWGGVGWGGWVGGVGGHVFQRQRVRIAPLQKSGYPC